jgi:phage baseplate assembly protein W
MTRNTRIFTDIDAAFQAHPTTGDLTVRTNERAIKFAVKSLVMTQHYERLFHSEIGTPVKRMLFENFDDMSLMMLREGIADVITNFEPRVTVIDVAVEDSRDNNALFIKIAFKIKNTETPLDVSLTLERSR